MTDQDHRVLAFNRGVLSSIGLARIDLDRYSFASEIQRNFIPRVLGSMQLRPGLKYIDSMLEDLNLVRQIPFVFEEDDTALLEIGVSTRIRIDDVLLTRNVVSTTFTNGNFIDPDDTSPPTGWTIDDDANCDSYVRSNDLYLRGSGEGFARCYQTVSPAGGDIGVAHGIEINIGFGPVRVKIGSTAQDNDLADLILEKGRHNLEITAIGDFTVEFSNDEDYSVQVSSCQIYTGDVLLPGFSTEATRRSLRWDQSGDRLYVTADDNPQRVYERRLDGRSWSRVDYTTRDGPFRTQNTSATTLAASAISGGYDTNTSTFVTLTASPAQSGIFQTAHQGGVFGPGALFRLESSGQVVTDTQASAVDVFTNPIRVVGTGDAREFGILVEGTFVSTARLQFAFDANGPWNDQGNTYTVPTSITFNDGQDEQIIFYRLAALMADYSSGSMTMTLNYTGGSIQGIARVIDTVDEDTARVEILQPFGSIDPTRDWWEAQWSGVRGFPTAVAIHEGRLWWGGNDRIWGSVSDDFESFDDNTEGDAGPINRTIATGAIRVINWMLSMARLMFGTSDHSADVAAQRMDGNNPLSARSTNFDEPLTPFNFNIKTTNSRGVFVDRTRQRLFELVYDIDIQDWKPVDLSVFAPDYNIVGIQQIAVQMKPDVRVHCVRTDGTVGILVYDRAENVMAWVDFELGGVGNWCVEDVAVLPGTIEDQVYYTVKAFNGVDGEERYLLKWSLESEAVGGLNNYMADAWQQYDGVPITTMTGLDHLAGLEVCVWADGDYVGNGTVTQFGTPGELDLSNLTLNGSPSDASNSSNVVVGLQYTAQFKSTKLATLQGIGLLEYKRVNKLGFIAENLHHLGLQYGPDFDTLFDLPQIEKGQEVATGFVWDTYHEEDFPFGGEWEEDSRVCLQGLSPRPATLLAAIAQFQSVEFVRNQRG